MQSELEATRMATVITAPGLSYTVTTFEDPDSTIHVTRGTAINNRGEITGWYEPDNTPGSVAGYTADLVDNGSGTLTVDNFTTVTDPQTGGVEPYGIDDSGNLVGGTRADGNPAGFRDVGGTFSTVTVQGAVNTTLWGTDDAGDFVGDTADQNGLVHGYVATSSGSSSFDIAGNGTTQFTFGYGINDAQVIVGSFTDSFGIHGYIDAGTGITILDVPGADGVTEAYGINSNGVVSGSYQVSPGQYVPYTYQDGTFTAYDNVAVAQFTNVGIDDAGQLIGTTSVPGVGGEGFIINPVVACFRRGTGIMTPAGEVAVEDLRQGDFVQTHAGETVAIIWIGHRRIDCGCHPRPRNVWPVRIRAGSFGDALPHRDLWLSPDHAVFVDGALIPVKYLINGTSIAQAPMDEVTYYHIELPCHDVLLAAGLPVESYLDIGDRSGFANGGGRIALYPDYSSLVWDAEGCAPLVVVGPLLEAVRHRVNAAARTKGVAAATTASRATPIFSMSR
jgi:collagen type I/II/III/V/XI/XXIV/XXVII alpha